MDVKSANSEPKTSALDWTIALALALFTIYYIRKTAVWHMLPLEDALMLLRYSQHVAQGFGIRWNIGDPPVEGATDFLFMVAIALLMKIAHLGAILSARLLIAASHVASVAMLYLGMRRWYSWPVWACICVALYLAEGIAIFQLSLGFGAPFYAMFALAAWMVVLSCLKVEVTARRGLLLGLFLLLTALTRPEGCFLAFFILAALCYARGKLALRAVVPAATVFMLFGGVYFIWRWHYFGYLFPNPFYLKGGGHIYLHSISIAVLNMRSMLLPVLPIALVELFSRHWRRVVTAAIPVLGFTAIWVLLSNENNYGMRFQYCVVPLALLSLPYCSQALQERFQKFRVPLWGQVLVIALTFVVARDYWAQLTGPNRIFMGSGAYHISQDLQPFKTRGYTIAASEAGTIPYFSEWRAIDTYGLNDAEIVHNPHGLTPEYLQQNNPAIILYHKPDQWGSSPYYQKMQATLEQYAETHNYELAAEWGTVPCDRHVWWVRRDLPERDQFLAIIRKQPHFYLASNFLAQDFRGVPYPDHCAETGIELTASQ